MKFIHIADIHLDRPFINLSNKENLGELRRLEQRKAFKQIIKYIQENEIPYLFISGDVYEHEYVKQSTIQFLDEQFKQIPNTQIFISPGNHDPYLQNSYYNQFSWAKNVHIFKSQFEKISLPEVDVYGYGFSNFYCTDCGLENVHIEDSQKLNICVLHGTVNGASLEEKQYNSISKNELESKGFDYVAMGHIHKMSYNDEPNQKIIYPAPPVALGFDELGKHGMLLGNLTKEKLELEFIPIEQKEFVEKEIDVTNILSREELIETINSMQISENEYVKIILNGKRNFEIDTYNLNKIVESEQIIKIKNHTKANYDLEKISSENTLRGMFAEQILQKMKQENLTETEQEILDKAVEIAFEALA